MYFDAVLVLDGRGYDFSMDGIVDRAMFEAILATVNFPRVARLDQTFTSALHGYSVRYPAAWSVSPATRTWQAAQMKPSSWTADTATSDVLGVVPWFEGRSTPLPAGQRFEEWYAAYAATRAQNTCTGNPTLEETVVVDGVVGRLDRHCEEYFLEAVVPKGDRVYVFTLYEPDAPLDFSGMLDSIVLTPSTAKG
jgi:hypothetical protein